MAGFVDESPAFYVPVVGPVNDGGPGPPISPID